MYTTVGPGSLLSGSSKTHLSFFWVFINKGKTIYKNNKKKVTIGLKLPPRKRSFRIESLTDTSMLARVENARITTISMGSSTKYGLSLCPFTFNAAVD